MGNQPTVTKILFYNDYSNRIGGAETYLENTLTHLQSKGIKTAKVAFNQTNSVSTTPSIHQRVKSLLLNQFLQKDIVKQFEQELEEFQPDILHINNNRLYTASINKVAIASQLPIVRTIHDYYSIPFQNTVKAGIHKRWLQTPISKANFIIPSYTLFHQLSQHSIPNLSYIPHFVDSGQWLYEKHTPKNTEQLLYVGRIEESKGIYVLLETMRQLKEINNRITLICIGEGDALLKVKILIQAYGLQNNIQLLGYQKQEVILQYFHNSAILLFPSITPELFGLVGIEAQASGIPVIASDVGGTREWCIPNQTGILIPPNDSSALSNAIQDLLQHPKRRSELTKNAYSFVRKHYNSEKSIQKLLQLYTQILEND